MLVTAILCVTMPPHTALHTVLNLLPVRRHLSRAGQLVLLFVMGFVFSIALVSISIAVVVKMYATPGHTVIAAVLPMVVIVLTQAIAVAVLHHQQLSHKVPENPATVQLCRCGHGAEDTVYDRRFLCA